MFQAFERVTSTKIAKHLKIEKKPFLSLSVFQLVIFDVQELEKRYEHGLPRLDPVEDMRITEPAISSAVQRIEQLEQQLSTNEVFKVRAWLRPFLGDWPRKQKIKAFGVNLMRSQVLYWTPQKGDWPVVHGIP